MPSVRVMCSHSRRSFFASEMDQTLVGKQDGRLCRFRPHKSSIKALLASHNCKDERMASFISDLMQPDPERRASAAEALQHPFLQAGGQLTPYRLDKADSSGEAGLRLLQKYKSLENVESPNRSMNVLGHFAHSIDGSYSARFRAIRFSLTSVALQRCQACLPPFRDA